VRAVDLFAGAGGFTLGAELAGAKVVWAANHSPFAVETHALNHPNVVHVCQDLRQAYWSALPAFDLLLAGPACQGHSAASQPKRRGYHDAMRATAWAVIDCVEVTRPRAVIVENVPAFTRWKLFDLWRAALVRLGYHTYVLTLRASRLGVPQRRDRVFVVGTRRRALIRCTESLDEPPFDPCIEAGAPGWRPIADAAAGAKVRIADGRARLGRRFLTQHTTGHDGVPLHEPIRTITTADHWALVDGDYYRPLTVRETARAMGFPDIYRWPASSSRREQIRGLGNAVAPPVAKAIVAAVQEAA
jgi:DNA (cytosine-5)-methyltransferase 1